MSLGGESWRAWGTLIKLSQINFKSHNPCPLFLHFHTTSSRESKTQTSLYINIQVTWLSYSGGEVPELFSCSSCYKSKSQVQSQLGGRRSLAQNSSHTISSGAVRVIRIATRVQSQPATAITRNTEKSLWVFFRKPFLHIPTRLQVSGLTFKSPACPSPATASGTAEPAVPKEAAFTLRPAEQTFSSAGVANNPLWTPSTGI